MDTLKIEIVNPKALKLLKDLADMNLINIKESPKKRFEKVLDGLRSQYDTTPSLDDITAEVEAVRKSRNAK
ncbi:hypothetical protein INP83_08205 [Mucilaginibacter sp. 21P]|uniref:hypothetical protein n=1 Tax=Mucilaginibacter sp. 21P TaxID=2778902 RepID=UPI001C592A90|nr:hypothetical protein [Mucilaginibacter sp. 21P]QXV67049.1 hypothetical protein INP83_08205 [Mucilaginibacter sp. 21P]